MFCLLKYSFIYCGSLTVRLLRLPEVTLPSEKVWDDSSERNWEPFLQDSGIYSCNPFYIQANCAVVNTKSDFSAMLRNT